MLLISFYFIDEDNENFFQIHEFKESLIKKEGSNCYATKKGLISRNNLK